MAEYFFYGTKGGLNALSSKTNHLSQTFDIRNNKENSNLLGKRFYSLSFISDGCIFSEYTWLNDSPRSNGFGFLGVDVFVSSKEKIQSIKELLDKLIDAYVSSYVKDDGINKNEPFPIVKEDFSFADNILRNYAETNRLVSEESFTSNASDDSAFLLYDSVNKLKELLDEPFRPEYCDYKRVFLIDTNLKEALEVVKHDSNADLTHIVDFNNLLYKIEECTTSTCNKQKVHKKDSLTITWKEKYCDPKTETGTLNDLVSKKIIEIDEENRVIKVLSNTLSKVTKKIYVSVVDYNGNPINKAILTYKNKFKGDKTDVHDRHTITLIGEETEHLDQFILYIEGLNQEYKVNKEGYRLNYPDTTIKLDKQKEISIPIYTPKITLRNNDCENINVDVSAKIGNEIFVYQNHGPIPEKIELKKIELRDEKKSENEDKKVDSKWNVRTIIIVLLLSAIVSFFLGFYFPFGQNVEKNTTDTIPDTTVANPESTPSDSIMEIKDTTQQTVNPDSTADSVTNPSQDTTDVRISKDKDSMKTAKGKKEQNLQNEQAEQTTSFFDKRYNDLSHDYQKFYDIRNRDEMESFIYEHEILSKEINVIDIKRCPGEIRKNTTMTLNQLLKEMEKQ